MGLRLTDRPQQQWNHDSGYVLFPSGLRDLYGRAVPADLEQVFEREYLAGAVWERLSRVRFAIGSLRRLMEEERYEAVSAKLDAAARTMIEAVEAGYPMVCPACDGLDDRRGECKKCRARGYLPNARLISGRSPAAAADRESEMLESAADRIDAALADLARCLPSKCCRQCYATGTSCKSCGSLGLLISGEAAAGQ